MTISLAIFVHELSAQSDDGGFFGRKNTSHRVDIKIFNRYDDYTIDTTYMGNEQTFHLLDTLMQDTATINHTQRIEVSSSSSVEGSVAYNTRLSRRRMAAIEECFRERYSFIPSALWRFSFVAEDWEHFREAVEADRDVPSRDEVLRIVDMESLAADERERLLRRLDGGATWEYIRQNILPAARGSASMLFVPLDMTPTVVDRGAPKACFEVADPLLPYEPLEVRDLRPIISLRTNLLLDVTSTINLAVEVPLSPRWSVSAEYITPWWSSWDGELTWQIESLYVDLRYWFGRRGASHNSLVGWSVGAYAGSGRYDLQPLSPRGVQGEYSDFGVTVSYAHTLGQSRRWLMEYTLGVGYLTTHYRNYYTVANTEEFGNIKVHNYPWSHETLQAPMPTRIGVTLCYLINLGRRCR